MEFRLWIGVWCLFLILIMVAFNLSFLVKYITRFTEDCFATLVAIIFIIDAIKSTFGLRKAPNNIANGTKPMANMTTNTNDLEGQLTHAVQEANFFFSCLLFLITFAVCMGLKSFRNKPYLPTKVNIC